MSQSIEKCGSDCGDGMCLFDEDSTQFYCVCSNKYRLKPGETCEDHRSIVDSNDTKGIFSDKELFRMNQMNGDSQVPLDVDVQSEFTSGSLSPVVISIIAIGVVCAGIFFILILLWKKRSKCTGCVVRSSRVGSPVKSAAAMSPRYASNPNYYTSGHDNSVLTILTSLEISRDKITFINELGEGCFGKVYKGELRSDETTLPVAVKVLKENASPEAEADFQREVEIMSGFYHENILPLLGIVMKNSGPMPWMVFEYMKYGDLTDVLRKNSPYLSPSQTSCQLNKESLLWIATQVAAGMLYLSQHHFVHRDLATRNCLVGANLVVKISDFGMSRDIYTCDYYKIGGSRLLPVRWMAPESIMYGKFTLESDVWSYGVLLWEVFTFAKQPYYGHSNEEVVKLILHGILLNPPQDCIPLVCDIMAGCWRSEPSNRLNFFDIHRKLIEHQCVDLNNESNGFNQQILDEDNYLIPKRQGLVTVV